MGVVPRHVAIIMDGNGRWAKGRGFSRLAGHHHGLLAVKKAVTLARSGGCEVLTLFALSTENYDHRPKFEVSSILTLLRQSIKHYLPELQKNSVRVRVVGDRSVFSSSLQQSLLDVELATQDNQSMVLVIALNYSGRWDVSQAVAQMVEGVDGQPATAAMERVLAKTTEMGQYPDIDLMIRTGGERRISNFALWQLAYAELYFCDALWPDFDKACWDQAIAFYGERERRFGQVEVA